jgi:predicted ATP-dependent endonuclease of OLD family
MRLKELLITNFRGYQHETRVPIDQNITGVTGRNDVGKSSVLEALDIFFEGGTITLDKDDFNILTPDAPIEIRAIFIDLPNDIMLDDANRTALAAEHLLNEHGELEIIKRY